MLSGRASAAYGVCVASGSILCLNIIVQAITTPI